MRTHPSNPPRTTNGQPKNQGRPIEEKSKALTGKIKSQRIAQTGRTSRVRGHVSARGRRAQGPRDSR